MIMQRLCILDLFLQVLDYLILLKPTFVEGNFVSRYHPRSSSKLSGHKGVDLAPIQTLESRRMGSPPTMFEVEVFSYDVDLCLVVHIAWVEVCDRVSSPLLQSY